MPSVIIDLDHTVLDTTRFKAALAKSLGLSMAQWNSIYAQAKQDYGGVFDEAIFLNGVSTEDRNHFAAVLKKLHIFLYSDSVPFLKQALASGWEVIIVTFGNKPWQEKKLQALKPHLPSAITTLVSPAQKIDQIKPFLKDRVIMIDDNAKELDAIKQAYPEVTAYWICRPNGQYTDTPPRTEHQTINSLTEIKL